MGVTGSLVGGKVAGKVVIWLCAIWLDGCVAVWLCDGLDVWLYGCLGV